MRSGQTKNTQEHKPSNWASAINPTFLGEEYGTCEFLSFYLVQLGSHAIVLAIIVYVYVSTLSPSLVSHLSVFSIITILTLFSPTDKSLKSLVLDRC